MTNGKTLDSGFNTRPSKSLNSRPVSAGNAGYQSTRQVNSTQPRPVSNTTVQQMRPVAAQTGSVKPPVSKAIGNQNPTTPTITTNKSAAGNPVENFINMMKNMVGSFAILSDEVIEQNMQLASGKGMTPDDRTVSFECADYLMSNLAFVFMGLVLDENFKNAFMESLMVELQIDSQPEEEKKKVRESMKDKREYKSNGSIVIGVTSFMPNVEAELLNRMNAGFASLDAFADEFDEEVSKLTPEQKIEYGFIFSNFMYLIRAFTHNDMFMSYVITVIEKVKQITGNR